MIKRKAFTLQLTERCNLACKYCYVLNRPKPESNDCSPELCQTFIDFTLKESGRKVKISFFGGEPLLRPDLIRHTVSYGNRAAHKHNKIIRFHIVTNGTLLDDAIGDYLAEENISVEVSIDGPQKVHDFNRPCLDGSGSFQAAYTNLIRFNKRHPNHEIQIFSVITETESLPWLRSLLKKLNTPDFTYNPVHLSAEQEGIFGKNCFEITECALRKRIELHRNKFIQGNIDYDEGINCQMSFFMNGKALRSCEVGINTTITTQSGKIYPCPLFIGYDDQIIGDIFHGFYKEKEKPYLDRTVDTLKSCRRCSIKYFCGGGCAFSAYQLNGSISSSPDKDFCTVAREYAKEIKKSIIALGSEKPEALIKLIDLSEKATIFQLKPRPQAINPNNFIIRLTGKCNLSCDYCYEAKKANINDHLDKKTARSIVNYIIGSPSKEPLISLFGGEPLLNWETGRFIIETLAKESEKHRKKCFFHIVTNGTLIAKDIAQTLARHNATIQISIDGSQNQHDLHRKYADGSGSYDAILRGVGILREINPDAKIDAQVVITPGNTNMIHIAKDLKARGFRRINFLKCTWEDRSSVKWSLDDIKKLIKAREDFFSFFLDSAITGSPEVDMSFAALVASKPEPQGLCECGTSEVYIDTRGDIYPCPLIYSPGKYWIGNCASLNPKKNAYFTLTNKEIEDDCAKCWAYSRCRGGCAAHCQKCPLTPIPSKLLKTKKLWCDLMRAEFARAIIAHKILEQYHPERLRALKSMFAG